MVCALTDAITALPFSAVLYSQCSRQLVGQQEKMRNAEQRSCLLTMTNPSSVSAMRTYRAIRCIWCAEQVWDARASCNDCLVPLPHIVEECLCLLDAVLRTGPGTLALALLPVDSSSFSGSSAVMAGGGTG